MTSSADDSPDPHWPATPLLDATFSEIWLLLQGCTETLQRCARDIETIEQRLSGLQLAYNDAADYAAARALTLPLTRRELQVLRLAARRLRNREIAVELGLRRGTVKNYMTSILGKLAARNRWEAVARARALGLI